MKPLTQTHTTFCNRDCPDTCAIEATVQDGRVIKLAGSKTHPVTRGALCHRTNRFLSTQYDPARLTQPLLRKQGQLVPVSWPEALDFIAQALLRIKQESGPAAIFHYRSGGSLGLLKTLSDHFFEQFGPVTIKRGDICSGAGEHAQTLDFGVSDSHDLFDLLNAKQIILWGKNVVTSSPHTLRVLKDARAKGAELTLIDPLHHRTAAHVDHTHSVRPGGDFALAMAVARVLFERGWTDPEAEEYCADLPAFSALVHQRSVEQWCQEADVPPRLASDLAQRLGPGKPCAILVGWGMGRRRNGAAIVRAIDALGAISGNLGISGGGVSFYFARRSAFDTTFIQGAKVAPRTICEPRFGPELLAAQDPPIRAVWITAGNPVAMLPQSQTVAEALASRELTVVVDAFLTDTAALATVVLPTTTLLEDDDLLGAYGHHMLGASRPVVPPPPGVKSDLQIMQALASRVGLAEVMAGDARAWKERIIAPRLGPHGVRLEDLEAGPVPNPLCPKVLFEDRRFFTPSAKVQLITEGPAAAPPPDPSLPLVLMSVSTAKSQAAQWAQPQQGLAVLTVHPQAASGLADGAEARLVSAIGQLRVRVHHDPMQRQDVAIMAKGGHYRQGRAANALIQAQVTDMGEGGALYDERVRLEPVAPS